MEPPAVAPSLDLAALAPLQRAFLVTDGTVTEFLEAYFLEPVAIRKLGSGTEIDGGCYRREVLLVGTLSGRHYAHARSTIWLDRLEPKLREGLLTTDRGIGQLLRQYRIETFRQICSHWSEPATGLTAQLNVPASTTLLCRTYEVYRCGQAIMEITEKFAADLFAG